MVVVSMLPHAEIGGNDHREEAPYFILDKKVCGKVICVVKRKKISREDDYPDSVPSSTGPSPHNSTTNTFNAFKTNLAAA